MSTPEPSDDSGTEAYVHLNALAMHIKAHGFTVELIAGGLIVRNPRAPGCCESQAMAGDTITCRPHQGDGRRYWFFTSWQQPIAEADRITDALVIVKGYLGAPE